MSRIGGFPTSHSEENVKSRGDDGESGWIPTLWPKPCRRRLIVCNTLNVMELLANPQESRFLFAREVSRVQDGEPPQDGELMNAMRMDRRALLGYSLAPASQSAIVPFSAPGILATGILGSASHILRKPSESTVTRQSDLDDLDC
jgi:hypothetical protein